MRNKTRIPDVIMACVLALLLLFTNAGAAGAAPAGMDAVVSASLQILCDNEGGYNSVNPDDNGALSIGKLQWHGWRAYPCSRPLWKQMKARHRTFWARRFIKK